MGDRVSNQEDFDAKNGRFWGDFFIEYFVPLSHMTMIALLGGDLPRAKQLTEHQTKVLMGSIPPGVALGLAVAVPVVEMEMAKMAVLVFLLQLQELQFIVEVAVAVVEYGTY